MRKNIFLLFMNGGLLVIIAPFSFPSFFPFPYSSFLFFFFLFLSFLFFCFSCRGSPPCSHDTSRYIQFQFISLPVDRSSSKLHSLARTLITSVLHNNLFIGITLRNQCQSNCHILHTAGNMNPLHSHSSLASLSLHNYRPSLRHFLSVWSCLFLSL